MSHPLDVDALFHCECGEWHYKSEMFSLSCKNKKTSKPTTRKFQVTASSKGVKFNIDHQGFTLYVESEGTKAQTLQRYKWYARQLRIALKRLKGSK